MAEKNNRKKNDREERIARKRALQEKEEDQGI